VNREHRTTALAICDFVQTWPGGQDGHVLAALEHYERTERKINPFDLEALSKLGMATGELYVTTMVKALSKAPGNTVSSNFVATVFGASDIGGSQPNGHNRQNAIGAIKLMQAFSNFLDAYSKRGATEFAKLTSDLEAKLATHVHNMKSDTRAVSSYLEAVSLRIYYEAKKVDQHLPEWSAIKELVDVRAKKPRLGGGLRETSSAGVTVSQMKERGFDVGTHIARINDEDEHVFGGVKLAGKMVEIRLRGTVSGKEKAQAIDKDVFAVIWAARKGVAEEIANHARLGYVSYANRAYLLRSTSNDTLGHMSVYRNDCQDTRARVLRILTRWI
jgi:hypothetical protein